MATYLEMQNFLFERVRNYTTNRSTNIKTILNTCMRVAASHRNFVQLQTEVGLTLTSGSQGPYYVTNPDVDKIKNIIYAGTDYPPPTQLPWSEFREKFPNPSTCAPGYPEYFSIYKYSPCLLTQSNNGVLSIKSTSASDTTQKVRIVGDNVAPGTGDDNYDRRIDEEITLTGITAVATTNSYKANAIVSISKNLHTTGRIIIKDASGIVISEISPKARFAQYPVLCFHPVPVSAIVCSLIIDLIMYDMISDNDIPGDINDPSFHDEILALAEAMIVKDSVMLGAVNAANADKRKDRGQACLRRLDISSYREDLEMGRR